MSKKKNDPLISVIVPSFNQGQFLKQALASIFKQNYARLEVIVMDGGSTDNSVEVIKSFGSQIAYWQSQPDGGQSAAINAGMRMAKGDLVAWLNSDDFYLKNAFSHLMKAYWKNPKASFYAGNGHRVTESGMIKEPFYPHQEVVFDRHSLIFCVDFILQPATFMSRSCLEQVNYLNPNLNYAMDWDLFIRLSEHAEPVIFHDLIAASREYSETKTASGYFRRIEELRQIAKTHSGLDLSPGVLCYLIGDLLELCHRHPAIYKSPFLMELHRLWSANTAVIASQEMDRSGYLIDRRKQAKLRLFVRSLLIKWLSIFKPVKDLARSIREYLVKIRIGRFYRSISKWFRTFYFRCKYGLYAD